MSSQTSWFPRLGSLLPALCLALGLLTLPACGTDDTATSSPPTAKPGDINQEGGPCQDDTNCVLGTVCGFMKVCVAAECQSAAECQQDRGHICYPNPATGKKTCSLPQCSLNTPCPGTQTCDAGVCKDLSCTDKTECPPTKVCQKLAKTCVTPPATCAGDNDCVVGKVCNLDTEKCVDEGAAQGCTTNDQCQDTQYCDTATSECKDGCRNGDSCADDQNCSGERQCVCDPTKCQNGQTCDPATQRCADLCKDVTCTSPAICDAATGQCVDPSDKTCVQLPSLCTATQVCNSQTGQCEDPMMMCANGKTQASCTTANAPYLDPVLCECVECSDATQCDQAAGEICNANRCIAQCQITCTNQPTGFCRSQNAATPYCLGDCCVQCVGPGDCNVAGGEICIDNTCGMAPTCVAGDPNACPAGNVCNNGKCEPAAAGGQCNSDGTAPCPVGQICEVEDPDNKGNTIGKCSGAGGTGACGGCKNDCTCDNGLTCDPVLKQCRGCKGGPIFPFLDTKCPSMSPLGGLCVNGLCIPLI